MNTRIIGSIPQNVRGFDRWPGSLSVDVLVVGGGVTGIVTAYLLQKAGVRVALVERERLASRDSGHTTAHLTHVMDKRLHELVKDFGRDHARAAWDAGAAAIDEIERHGSGRKHRVRVLPRARISACAGFRRKNG